MLVRVPKAHLEPFEVICMGGFDLLPNPNHYVMEDPRVERLAGSHPRLPGGALLRRAPLGRRLLGGSLELQDGACGPLAGAWCWPHSLCSRVLRVTRCLHVLTTCQDAAESWSHAWPIKELVVLSYGEMGPAVAPETTCLVQV